MKRLHNHNTLIFGYRTTSHGPNTLKVSAAKHGDFLDIYIALSPLTVLLSLFCTYIKPKFFLYLNRDVLSGTHISKRTRNYGRVSNTLQFKLPPRLGPSHNTSLPHELPSLESQRQYHKLLHNLNHEIVLIDSITSFKGNLKTFAL